MLNPQASQSTRPAAFRAAPTISIRWQHPASAAVQNFAIGGAFVAPTTAPCASDPSTRDLALCGKGLQFEVDQFLNVGTQSLGLPDRRHDAHSQRPSRGLDRRQRRPHYQQSGGTLAGAERRGDGRDWQRSTSRTSSWRTAIRTISFLAAERACCRKSPNNPAGAADPSGFLDGVSTGASRRARGICGQGFDRPLSRPHGKLGQSHREPGGLWDHQGTGLSDLP